MRLLRRTCRGCSRVALERRQLLATHEVRSPTDISAHSPDVMCEESWLRAPASHFGLAGFDSPGDRGILGTALPYLSAGGYQYPPFIQRGAGVPSKVKRSRERHAEAPHCSKERDGRAVVALWNFESSPGGPRCVPNTFEHRPVRGRSLHFIGPRFGSPKA